MWSSLLSAGSIRAIYDLKCRQGIADNEIGNYQEKDRMKVVNLLQIIKQTKLKTVSLLKYVAIQCVGHKCLNPL